MRQPRDSRVANVGTIDETEEILKTGMSISELLKNSVLTIKAMMGKILQDI